MRTFSDIPYELQRTIVPLSNLSRVSREGLNASRTQILRQAPLSLPKRKEMLERFNELNYCKVIYYISLVDTYESPRGDIDFSAKLFVDVEKDIEERYSFAGIIDSGYGDFSFLTEEELDKLSEIVESKQNWIEDTNLLSFPFLQVRDYSMIDEYIQVDLESMFKIFETRVGKDITPVSYSTFKQTVTTEINRIANISNEKKAYLILLSWAHSLLMFTDWTYQDVVEYVLTEPILEIKDSLLEWVAQR